MLEYMRCCHRTREITVGISRGSYVWTSVWTFINCRMQFYIRRFYVWGWNEDHFFQVKQSRLRTNYDFDILAIWFVYAFVERKFDVHFEEDLIYKLINLTDFLSDWMRNAFMQHEIIRLVLMQEGKLVTLIQKIQIKMIFVFSAISGDHLSDIQYELKFTWNNSKTFKSFWIASADQVIMKCQ